MNRPARFSVAEGCMFSAVGLFVLLLIALLVIVVLQVRNPPDPALRTPPPAGAPR